MVGLFGLEPYHSAPISLDMIQNTLLQEYMGDSYRITTNNAPMEPTCSSIYNMLDKMPLFVWIFMWGKLYASSHPIIAPF